MLQRDASREAEVYGLLISLCVTTGKRQSGKEFGFGSGTIGASEEQWQKSEHGACESAVGPREGTWH